MAQHSDSRTFLETEDSTNRTARPVCSGEEVHSGCKHREWWSDPMEPGKGAGVDWLPLCREAGKGQQSDSLTAELGVSRLCLHLHGSASDSSSATCAVPSPALCILCLSVSDPTHLCFKCSLFTSPTGQILGLPSWFSLALTVLITLVAAMNSISITELSLSGPFN